MLKRSFAIAALAVGMFSAVSARGSIINGDVTTPADPIVGIAATVGSSTSSLATVGTVAGANNYPSAEFPANAIDNNTTNKYLNFQKTGSGFIETLLINGPATLSGVHFSTGNDAPERDPLTITLEGTNDANPTATLNSAWSPIYSGVTGLATDPGRNTFGSQVTFVPTTPGGFSSYRLLVSGVRDATAANSFQFGEVEIVGSTVPEPSALGVLALAGIMGMRRRR